MVIEDISKESNPDNNQSIPIIDNSNLSNFVNANSTIHLLEEYNTTASDSKVENTQQKEFQILIFICVVIVLIFGVCINLICYNQFCKLDSNDDMIEPTKDL